MPRAKSRMPAAPESVFVQRPKRSPHRRGRIARDTETYSRAEAEAYAEANAKRYASLAYYLQQKTEREWFEYFLQQRLNEPRGSAQGQKGILAVAAACCGGQAAATVEQYLRR